MTSRGVWLRQQRRFLRSPQGFFVVTTLIPLLIFYIGWMFIPLIYTMVMSLYDWKPMAKVPQEFVGVENYREAFRDPIFYITMRNSVYFAALSVPIGTAISLTIAMILNSMKRFVALYRTVYFIPVVTSMVVCAIMWKWLYQPQFGFINSTLRQLNEAFGLNLPRSVGWLTDKDLALNSLIAMSIWKDAGFAMVIFLAGLQGIPSTFYDAAKVDGANWWQVTRHITVPLLQPTTIFVLVTGMIGALQVFTQVFIMTTGGPGNATRVIVYYLYEKAFLTYRFGYASALAFILFAVILLLTLIQLRVLTVRWDY